MFIPIYQPIHEFPYLNNVEVSISLMFFVLELNLAKRPAVAPWLEDALEKYRVHLHKPDFINGGKSSGRTLDGFIG